MMSETVTIERVERALALCAYLVELDGPVVVPLFERLERELAAMRRQEGTVERAKRLLKTLQTTCPNGEVGKTIGHRLSLAPPLASEDGPDAGVHSTAPQP
jgi:hypothetical protein